MSSGLPNNPQCSDIKGYEVLSELALDLIWSWNHSGDKLWSQLDPQLWEITNNPWTVLQTVSKEKLERAFADPSFRKNVQDLVQTHQNDLKSPTWFQQNHPKSSLNCIAYFSMEYMLSEALPIYSGGLGNVAGDQLKSASDLGIPVVAIGLLYQQGYFRQMIDKDGLQQALYPYNDPMQLPITPLRKSDGEWLRLEIPLPGWPLWLRAWEAQVGRVKLYLLDSNDAANFPVHRGITSELYGGDSELRLKQELCLGIGGWRLLNELGIKPDVCHLNEGHAAFAILERAKNFMQETGQPFEVALAATRAGNLFTTHTAVPAGFDRFSPSLIDQYLKNYIQKNLHISLRDLLALGREDPNNLNEDFNMAYLAIRGSGAINGVSQLHSKVSKHLFESLFPHWPENEVPVGHVTNGVHMPSWDSKASDHLWTETCGKKRWLGSIEVLEKEIQNIPTEKLWQMRNDNRKILIDYARKRLSRLLEATAPESTEFTKHLFDPNTLTLGFARRFATYKRPNMLLQDPERLLRILKNPNRPVQLILAGKAHPADKQGQALIQAWIQFIRRPEARSNIIFLSDYDMNLTEHLVQGVDVWINTPRRPWEACGTSGMKVLVNGGLNLSELDGWWAEAYSPEVGWPLGDGLEHNNDPETDAIEAAALYDILENEVIPEFYTRDQEGIPTRWIERIRASMSKLAPQFSANRTVREYTEKYYIPAAVNYNKRAANKGALGKKIVEWIHHLEVNWKSIRFGDVKIEEKKNQYEFEVQVYLNDLDPNSVRVELYAEPIDEKSPVREELEQIRQLAGTTSMYIYQGIVAANRPPADYTLRIIPNFPDVSVPLEASQILWQK